jgi:hypothetical protein
LLFGGRGADARKIEVGRGGKQQCRFENRSFCPSAFNSATRIRLSLSVGRRKSTVYAAILCTLVGCVSGGKAGRVDSAAFVVKVSSICAAHWAIGCWPSPLAGSPGTSAIGAHGKFRGPDHHSAQ